MKKSMNFSEMAQHTIEMNLDYADVYATGQPVRFGNQLHVESPTAVVEWCELESYDSHKLASNIGESHYELTLMAL